MADELIQIPKPELGRPNDSRLTAEYIKARPELAGVSAFDPQNDVDIIDEVNKGLAKLHALAAYGTPEVAEQVEAILPAAQQVLADIAQSQESNNAATARNLGRKTAPSVAEIGADVGLYNITSGSDAGQVWERMSDGSVSRAPGLEAASAPQLQNIKGQIEMADLDMALASTTTATRQLIGGQRGGTFDLLPSTAPYADEELGGMVFERGDGTLLRRREFDSFIVATAWDLSGDDCVPELQKAVNYAAKKGKALLWPASPYQNADGSVKHYVMRSKLYLPAGFYLMGEVVPLDTANVAQRSATQASPQTWGFDPKRPAGTLVLMRDNAQFEHDAGSGVLRITEYYDEQNYNIQVDVSQPDGLQAFQIYPVTHLMIGEGTGAELGNINVLGAYDWCASAKTGCNPAKTYIHNIRGAVLNMGISIPVAYDILQIDDVFFNLNSMSALLAFRFAADSTYDQHRLYIKVAKNMRGLCLGRVDDIHVYRLFVYGGAVFAEFTNLGGQNDTGNGGGAHFVNCCGDIVGYGVVLDRANMNGFCVKFTNCWFTPNVYGAKVLGNVIPVEVGPALVYSTGGNDHHNQLFFNNVSVYGAGEDIITGSASRKYTLIGNGGGAGTDYYFENVLLRHQTSTLNSGQCFSGWSRDRSKARLHLGTNVVVNDVERIDSSLRRFEGGTPGALVNGTAQMLVCTRDLRISVERTRAVLGTGPTNAGAVRLKRNGAEIAGFYFGSGQSTTGKGPQFANPVADAYLRENDVVTITYDSMDGAKDLAYAFVFEADLTRL